MIPEILPQKNVMIMKNFWHMHLAHFCFWDYHKVYSNYIVKREFDTMKNMFSAGELANYQNISKQTLLYYDKIGLFKPCYTDPENGYRYYSAKQLDALDTILIMKKIGFSLNEIKDHMTHYTTENSILFFQNQLRVIEEKIQELSLIQSRLEHRCQQIEHACSKKPDEPSVFQAEPICILCHDVEPPYGMREISIATKQCYAQAFSSHLPIFFQCGVSVPLERILDGSFTKASIAFVTTDPVPSVSNIQMLPAGLAASVYHFGNYYDMSQSYLRLLEFCKNQHLKIISDSYEFCINDSITSRYTEEFITKIMFYVQPESSYVI